ncbi:hypothetical protein LshimejAT787_0108730 [Lyophyllum shimeji]|uniref:Uncharacterized protein n=1 Tax=Lyophyllum shimeji TaxID=47721 RepID=A0A9P3PEG0_LYOSH|nr:hypothetical protein LshimejAT787_0108730 [Lyophyllum shimeji]
MPSRSRDIESELKQYMNRPPRLGVGAAIPETHKASRETARLKGQLIGKGNKRPRDDEDDAHMKEESDNEGESRAGAIKKKARVDPFATGGGKKKKNKMFPEGTALVPPKPPVLSKKGTKEQEEVISMVTEAVAGPSTPVVTPKRKKHKEKHLTVGPSADAAVVTESSLTPMSPPGAKITDSSSNSPKKDTTEPSNTPPKKPLPIDVSLTSTPVTPLRLRRQAQSAELLKQPLLNLAPPGDDDESEDDAKIDVPGGSPKKKKKRKRRKKKKGVANESTVEARAGNVADEA